jgi:hypothetical protein
VTQAYVGLALGRGLGAGPCLIWLADADWHRGTARRNRPRAPLRVKNCVKQPMAIRIGAGSRLRHDDHLVRLGASEMRLQEFVAAAFRRPLRLSHSVTGTCASPEPATPGKTVSAHRVENGVGPRKPDHSLWLLKPREIVLAFLVLFCYCSRNVNDSPVTSCRTFRGNGT